MVLAKNEGLLILLIIIVVFLVIGGIAFAIHKILTPKLKNENKQSEADIAKEELDRILQPVEDEKVAKEIADYKEDD